MDKVFLWANIHSRKSERKLSQHFAKRIDHKSSWLFYHLQKIFFSQNRDAKLLCLGEFAARFFADDDEVGLLGDAAGRFAAELMDFFFHSVSCEML